MPRSVVSTHGDRLRFFMYAYVAEEWPRDLDRVDGVIIRDFLGSWYPRHAGGTRRELTGYLSTFRRFYEYLYNTGRLSAMELEDILSTCSRGDLLMDLWEEVGGKGLVEKGEYPGRPELGPGYPAPEFGSALDPQLWMIARNVDRNPAPASLDFSLFLDYLQSRPIKLTRAKNIIPRPDVMKINEMMSSPESIPQRTGMERSVRITWFMQMGLTLGLLKIKRGDALQADALAGCFLDLDPDAQFALLMEATWNRIAWRDLGAREPRRLSDWAMEHRDGFAALLSDLPAGRDWSPRPTSDYGQQDVLLARYIYLHAVVETRILYALTELGIMEARMDQEPGGHPDSATLSSLSMTRIGKLVMTMLTRRATASEGGRRAPVAALEKRLLP